MSQTQTEPSPLKLSDQLDLGRDAALVEGYQKLLGDLAENRLTQGERADLIDRIDRAGLAIEAAQTQSEALLAVAGAAAKDYHAGLISDAELQQVFESGARALHDGLDDETQPEMAIIEASNALIDGEIRALNAERDARGDEPMTGEEAARHNDLLHPAFDVTEAMIEISGDGRNALGDAARAMAETRAELSNADPALFERQLEACDRARDSDEQVIDAHTRDFDMMHDIVDVASDAYRDGTIWPGMDEIYVEPVLHDRIEEVREAHGRAEEPEEVE